MPRFGRFLAGGLTARKGMNRDDSHPARLLAPSTGAAGRPGSGHIAPVASSADRRGPLLSPPARRRCSLTSGVDSREGDFQTATPCPGGLEIEGCVRGVGMEVMSSMSEFFGNPLNTFLLGLAIGLGLAAYAWFNAVLRRRDLRKEVAALKDQLHRQMTIFDKGNEKTLAELEQLRKENENLRITVATLKAKPGRAEIHTLHVYDKAVRLMHQKAPGFAPAWEGVMAEAQKDIDRSDSGIVALVRKAFRPSLEARTAGGDEPEPATTSKSSEPAD